MAAPTLTPSLDLPFCMVVFTDADGAPGFEMFDTLDSAVPYLESLVNQGSAGGVRVFQMEPVDSDLAPVAKPDTAA